MKRMIQNNLIRTYIILTTTLFFVEFIFRILNGMSLFSMSVFRMFITISTLTFPASYFINKAKEKRQVLWVFLFSVVLTLFIMIQMGCYNFLGNYVTISILNEVGNTEGFIMEFLRNFDLWYLMVLIPLGVLILYYLLLDRRIKKQPSRLSMSYAALILIGLNGLLYLSVSLNIFQNKYQVVSNLSLFRNPNNQNLAVNQFGLLGYELLDIKSLVLPSESVSEYHYEKPEEVVETPVEEVKYDRIIDDSNWKTLADNTNNQIFTNLNNYYMSKRITDKNEMTGIFKDKNIIMIMVESGSDALVSYPDLFPNIYNLYTQGWSWSHNYSSKNQCATINNEFATLASIFTISNSCTASSYQNNVYPQGLFNVFKNAGYHVSSYHNYMDYYYNRRVIHRNLGDDSYSNAKNLKIDVPAARVWPSDVELFENSFNSYINEDKFFAFYTTVTMHLPYSESSTYGDKYLDLFNDLDISLNSKRYLSKVKEFDNAVGRLMELLTNSGKLDDTIIVVFCDHYPYGLSNKNLEQILNYDVSERKEREKTPFIIYGTNIERTIYDDYTTLVNIAPTITNLFDLSYDPRLYSGFDIFSKDYEGRAIFHDGSWQDEYAFYNATNGDLSYMKSDYSYSDEEIYNINLDISNRITMANTAIKNNYFYYLNNGIEKLIVEQQKESEEQNEVSDSGVTE